jgi:cytochrome c oxidase subunit 2
MQHFRRLASTLFLGGLGSCVAAAGAFAQAPRNWELGMQKAHSPVKEQIASLHDLVLIIITLITIFVAGLLLYVVWRFSNKRNLVASRTSHNTVIEIAWTVIPVLILVVIAIPSFRLIYFEDRARDADMTIKVTGHQWLWEYTYPDAQNIDFQSAMIPTEDLKPGQLRLLDVDNPLVLPAGKTIRILTTSTDVIHSFFIPSLGVQRYAIPGRTIETWVKIDQPGDYYGECNQICGTNHSQMPISIHAVTDAEFTAWIATAKTKFAQGTPPAAPAIREAAADGRTDVAQVQR